MVVDDSAMMRMVIANMLTKDTNLVVMGCAGNGKQALEKLEDATSLQPDLVLLDLEMPEMDGIEFLKQARTKTKAKIVVLTSVAPAGSYKAATAIAMGADAIVSKPSGAVSFDLETARGTELFGVIYRLLGIGISGYGRGVGTADPGRMDRVGR